MKTYCCDEDLTGEHSTSFTQARKEKQPRFHSVMVVIGIKEDMIDSSRAPENSNQELRGLEDTKTRIRTLRLRV